MSAVSNLAPALGTIVANAAGRGRRALPRAILFGAVHALEIGAIAYVSLVTRQLGFGTRTDLVIATFVGGAFLGGTLAWAAAAVVAGHRPASARFAAMLIALTLGTAGGIALVYFFKYRSYFAAFHADFGTFSWLVELAFTGASAAYTFIVSGLPLILPLGLVPLLAGAAAFARRPRG